MKNQKFFETSKFISSINEESNYKRTKIRILGRVIINIFLFAFCFDVKQQRGKYLNKKINETSQSIYFSEERKEGSYSRVLSLITLKKESYMCIFKIISRCLLGAKFGAKARIILARLEIHTIHPVLKYTIINRVAKQAHTIPKIHLGNQKKTRIACCIEK